MGRSYWFECSRCGYRAKVAGGAARGLNLFVQTIVCRDCKELYDAVTRIRVSARRRPLKNPPGFSSALNRLLYAGLNASKWFIFKLRCPKSAHHRVQSWNEPGKCPRCGVHLDKKVLPSRVW